MTALISCC